MRDADKTSVDAAIVLRRAIELDGSAEAFWQGSLDERLNTLALAEIASEVGVSATAVAAAVAEAQAGALDRQTVMDRVVGPRLVAANRVIDVDDEEAKERLLDWLSVAHGLRPRIRPDGVIVAQRRRDLAGRMGTRIRKLRGLGGLANANTVHAATVAASRAGDVDGVGEAESSDPGAICLVVDVASKRNEAIVGGSAVAAGVSVVVTFAVVLSGPAALVGLPVAAGLGTVVARTTHRTTVRRMTESVEDTVDGVVQGDEPPHPLRGLRRRRRSSPSR